MNDTSQVKEQMDIIHEMIVKTKKSYTGGANLFLIWGWGLVIISSLVYAGIQLAFGDIVHLFWIGLAIPGIWYARAVRNLYADKVLTYTDSFIQRFWSSMGIAFFFTLAVGFIKGFETAYPIFILLMALSARISGSVLEFKPLSIGGGITFIVAVASLFVDFPNLLLIFILACITSFVIPGHLLSRADEV